MVRLACAAWLVGLVLGACAVCEDEDREQLDIAVAPGTYRVDPTADFPGATAVVSEDEVVFEFDNPDGARTRVTYRAQAPTWSEVFAR